jgi:hypothetical protein
MNLTGCCLSTLHDSGFSLLPPAQMSDKNYLIEISGQSGRHAEGFA